MTRPSWTANNSGALTPELAAQFRPLEVLGRWEAIGQAGGTILRDRLWFFSGSQQDRNDTRTAAFSARPLTSDEPFASVTERRVIGKLTAALPRAIRMEGFVARNLTDASGLNAGPLVEPDAMTTNDWSDDIWSVRFLGAPTDRWLLDARHGGNHRDGVSGPATGRRNGPPPRVDLVTAVQAVNAQVYSDWNSWIRATSAALTRYVDGRAGFGHELKAGLEYERAGLVDSSGHPGGRLYYDQAGQPFQVISGTAQPIAAATAGRRSTSRTHGVSAFRSPSTPASGSTASVASRRTTRGIARTRSRRARASPGTSAAATTRLPARTTAGTTIRSSPASPHSARRLP
ncbi:MAG TPA: hypothetical protein VMO26_26640 [Vicinamibacterales bacterium]|nr:hypothetical protein [Vicinamibacterales bacterium]